MNKNFWKSLKLTPALIGASLLVTSQVQANEDLTGTQADGQIIDQLDVYSSEGGLNSTDQVTSVGQLSDVSPTSWAYEALRSLVERYGCIVGYPDRTYRGERALSRYEFAAGLNACMQQMERLIASSEAVLREDIEKLKRLMKEFEAELAALGARVDNLEGRVAFLEDHQFSTTTKLSGEVILALSQDFMDNNQAIFADRVRLVLNTSFSGEDTLVTRLSAGNAKPFRTKTDSRFRTAGQPVESFTQQTTGSATLNQTFNAYPGADNDVQIDWLAYFAPLKLGEDTQFQTYVAGFGGLHYDYVPTLNPYFEDFDGGNGALSTFAQGSPIYRIGGGSGVALSYQLGFLEGLLGPSTATVSYMAGGDPASPEAGNGLFNGDYSVLGQLNFNISDSFAVGLTYVHGFHKADSPVFGAGSRADSGIGYTGYVGTALANQNNAQLNEFLTEDFGPNIVVDQKDKSTNSYGAQVAWNLGGASLSGFFNYTNLIRSGRGNDDIWSYGGGIAFPDFGKEGSVLGIFAGVAPYNGNDVFYLTDTVTGESFRTRVGKTSTPVHVEAFYKYQINDNISLTPGVMWISNPQQGREGDHVIGTLRTTFTF
jgi:hypothetical protein